MALSLSRPNWRAVRRSLFSDTSLVMGQMVFQNLLRIVSSMTLTRLLSAGDFAVVGLVSSVLVTLALISDIGLAAFIIRHERTMERDFRDEVWTLRLIRGIALSVLIAVLAVPIAGFMQKPHLAAVIAVAGLYEVVSALTSLAPTIALRQRRLRLLTAIDMGAQIVGFVIAIVMALLFRSYWGIIFSNLIGQVLGVVLSYVLYDDSAQRFRFSRERAAEMWRFSRFITGSTILTLVITQADKLVLPRLWSLDQFGLYIIAAGLTAAPMALVTTYAGRVLYPLLAEVQREAPETMAWRFYKDRWVPTLVYSFAAGGFVGFGPSLIALLYDPRYLGAGHYLQILSISTFAFMGPYAANEVMVARGKPKFTFTSNVVRLVYLIAAGTVGYLTLGPLGIVWAVGTVEVIAQLFAWFVLRREGLLDMRRETGILLVAALGFAIGYGADHIGRVTLALY